MYFTTTRLHQELAGGRFVDVIIDEAHDPASEHPFKGNVDLAKLQKVIDEVGAENIPYVCIATTVNMAGGQPISLANLRAGARTLQRRTASASSTTPRASPRTPTSSRSASPATPTRPSPRSSTRSAPHRRLHDERQEGRAGQHRRLPRAQRVRRSSRPARNLVVVYEGLHTYGGMAGRDMEAVAIGIGESVQYDHIRARVGQVEYLGEKLQEYGVPIVVPIGGHGVFLDAKAFLPHLDQDAVPGPDAGRGALPRLRRARHGARQRDRRPRPGDRQEPASQARTGAPHHPAARLHPGAHGRGRRVASPRSTRTATAVKGLEMVYEPKDLRFFQARFEPLA